ncbi:MAG: cobalt-precorrin-5B (C(1))-methyltransferase [Actinobacteria bacterium]|nr:cobalt-precorrin-5B (C(1))-methyltransferase [Actinomycetota bacterium]
MKVKFVQKKDEYLRFGYTTGACAAAAAKAATLALLNQYSVERVEIDLPQGDKASFEVKSCIFDQNQATCSVIKDAGDDPDVTHGAKIFARVSRKANPGVDIRGGKGVGVVTKPGLEIPVGMPAINPVPRRMIMQEVMKAAGCRLDNGGIEVEISVPKGVELAKKTLNSRLGIKNGISILGTTGIVIPYSVCAYTACISQALDVAVACGCREVVLTTGRRSEKFAQRELSGLSEECFILSGDFIGYSLEECAKRRLHNVIIWSMVGKISKLAAGNLYTNVSDSILDIDFLTRVALGCGIPDETAVVLQGAVTASQFRSIVPPEYKKIFCDRLCQLAAKNCRQHTSSMIAVECIMADTEGTVLGRASADE